MRKIGAAVAVLGVAVLASGCLATRNYVNKGIAEQQSALNAERTERQSADEKLAADVAQLRTDLNALRTEFGAKIAAVEEGLSFTFPIHFSFDDAAVQQGDIAALDNFAKVVNKHFPGTIVTIEGFADPAGSRSYNQGLSTKRAESVRNYLVNQEVQAELKPIGYGETRLVVPGAEKDEPGADLNRRVVFVIESRAPAIKPAVTMND
ncbi:MAG TPA: OmpA family protein [Longimicrobiales bacterium]